MNAMGCEFEDAKDAAGGVFGRTRDFNRRVRSNTKREVNVSRK